MPPLLLSLIATCSPLTSSGLPFYAFCSPEKARHHANVTRDGWYDLLITETFWRDRHHFLVCHGYDLRPRYHPDWSPSWLGTNKEPAFCEDSISLQVTTCHIIDAICKKDGTAVSIKAVARDGDEVRIARYLSSSDILPHPMNHCVPIVDVLDDPFDDKMSLMVMPYLRSFDDPDFSAFGEVVDFVSQTLEGLCFLHSQGVAHRDCASANIMMDGRPLFPHGHHPVRLETSQDGVHILSPLSRIDHPVRYYFIDFGISSQFKRGESPLVLGRKGRDKETPELSSEVPYNAFKVDIFVLGNLYRKELIQKYHGLEFLEPLVRAMTTRDPAQRPTAEGAFSIFEGIRRQLNGLFLRWRLRPLDETTPERVVYDTLAVAREGIHHLNNLIG
ncbi:kinase-like domain-containing protein [Amylocystis lapponica]|nr:kinase-like domain-containing protein [Amylocystis lapponica]